MIQAKVDTNGFGEAHMMPKKSFKMSLVVPSPIT